MKSDKKIKNKFLIRAFILFILVSGFFSITISALAATLNITPASGTYSVGDTFTASVSVSSTDKSVNAIDGIVSFPTEKLQVTSISKEGSVINLWAEEPSFSNSTGKVSMSGVILNPGYLGGSGKILKINFKVLKSGNAAVVFSSGSILANDGLGTNVLTNLNNAQLTLSDQGTTKTTTPSSSSTTSPTTSNGSNGDMVPVISSSTHPDPNKWYNNDDAIFSWSLPESVIGVRVNVDHDALSVPKTKYATIPSIEEKNLADGVWYLHVRFENKKGLGETSHFRFQVDTTPPTRFDIKFPNGSTTDNSKPSVTFFTSDVLSGISHYRVKIGDGNFVDIEPGVNINPYILPPQDTGTRDIDVEAYDLAGNKTENKASFTILPSPFSRIVKTLLLNTFFIALLLLILTGIYFLIIRTWHKLALLRHKLRTEVVEISSSFYKSQRKKVDDEFISGNYLSAISGYRKLQEQTPSGQQPELNERINLTVKLFMVGEIFKKAKLAASHNKWQEAKVLLEESESAMDPSFIFHAEIKRLYEEAKEHLAQNARERNDQEVSIEKRLIESQNTAHETKEKLIQEHTLLLAEKEVVQQKEAENERLNSLLKEKELNLKQAFENAEIRIREKELVLKQALDNTGIRTKEKEMILEGNIKKLETEIAENRNKLAEAMAVIEATKIKLAEEHSFLMAEKTRREELEEANRKSITMMEEKEVLFKEALNKAEQTKIIKLTQDEDLMQAQKAKTEELEKEIKNLENLLGEKEALVEQARNEVELRTKEKDDAIKKNLEESEAKIDAREEEFRKELESINIKKREQEAELRKSMQEIEVQGQHKIKEKEEELKKELEMLESKNNERIAELKKEIEDIKTQSEKKVKEKEYLLQQSLADAGATIKLKEEEYKKQIESIEIKYKEQEVNIRKEREAVESAMKNTESALRSTLENTQGEVVMLKERLANAERQAEEAKAQLAREQAAWADEKSKTENLRTAISKFINPNA